MLRQPLAEVFGHTIECQSAEATRYRSNQLCPYNNKVPNCTKDSITSPLGVCSLNHGDEVAIICPVRFREDWLIAEHAAQFFFPKGTLWTTLVEVRLNDMHGKSAGNIDVVLVAYDKNGYVVDFGALEVQAVYISGALRKTFFQRFMEDPESYLRMDWSKERTPAYPRPDYLSSSRKRLAPQLIYKGGILKSWEKKQAVAVHSAFYNTLPSLPEVSQDEADIAWLIYDLVLDEQHGRYVLTHKRTVYTAFKASLDKITLSEAGPIDMFIKGLQSKVTAKLGGKSLDELSDVPVSQPLGDDEFDLIDELKSI